MITQKGLKSEDVVVIIGERSLNATFNVGFPECEEYSELKHYASKEELLKKISGDLAVYMERHAGTEFKVPFASGADTLIPEPEEPLDDSWGSLFNDISADWKSKLFNK